MEDPKPRRPYEKIVDRVPGPSLSAWEAIYVVRMLADPYPSDDYRRLVVELDADGCQFPRVQAALMLLNTPGVATTTRTSRPNR